MMFKTHKMLVHDEEESEYCKQGRPVGGALAA
jgi:hypothetical protein